MIRSSVWTLIQPSGARRQAKTSECTRSPSITASSRSRPNGAVEIVCHTGRSPIASGLGYCGIVSFSVVPGHPGPGFDRRRVVRSAFGFSFRIGAYRPAPVDLCQKSVGIGNTAACKPGKSAKRWSPDDQYRRQDLQCVGWIRTGSPAHTLNQTPDIRRQGKLHGATPLLPATPISRSQFSSASSIGSHRPSRSLPDMRAIWSSGPTPRFDL